MLQDELEQWASAHFKHIQIIKRRWGTWDCYFLAALFSIWCLFRLCFLANFMFFKNFGSHPGNHNKNKIIKLLFLITHPSCSCVSWWRVFWDRCDDPFCSGYERCGSYSWPFWVKIILKQAEYSWMMVDISLQRGHVTYFRFKNI